MNMLILYFQVTTMAQKLRISKMLRVLLLLVGSQLVSSQDVAVPTVSLDAFNEVKKDFFHYILKHYDYLKGKSRVIFTMYLGQDGTVLM